MDCSCQVPLPMEFSRQEYSRGVPFPTPGHLPDPGIETASLASPALAGGFFTTCTTWETLWSPTYQYLHLLSSTSISSVLLFLVAQSYLTLLHHGLALGALWDFPWRNFPGVVHTMLYLPSLLLSFKICVHVLNPLYIVHLLTLLG